MEMVQIDTSTAPKEPTKLISWLYDRLDEVVQTNANVVAENELLQGQVEQRDSMLVTARQNQKKHAADITEMGIELNRARAAAATAVEDYRNSTST